MRMEKKKLEKPESERVLCCPFTLLDDGSGWTAGTCLGPDCQWFVEDMNTCAVVGLYIALMGLSAYTVKKAEKKKGGLFNEGSKN